MGFDRGKAPAGDEAEAGGEAREDARGARALGEVGRVTGGVFAMEERVREAVHGARADEIRANDRRIDGGKRRFIRAKAPGDCSDQSKIALRIIIAEQARPAPGYVVADKTEAVGVFLTPSEVKADEKHERNRASASDAPTRQSTRREPGAEWALVETEDNSREGECAESDARHQIDRRAGGLGRGFGRGSPCFEEGFKQAITESISFFKSLVPFTSLPYCKKGSFI